MANEPNNAEEQLKQYAAERRQLVPGEIHPATRNLLQGEVARTYGGAAGEARKPVRLRWLPALVWIAILAAIPLFFLPRNPETKKTEEALPAKENEVVLPTQSKPGEAPIELSDTKTPVKAPNVISPRSADAAKDAVAPAPVAVAPTTPPPAPVMREEAQLAGSGGNMMQRSRTIEAVPKAQAGRAASEPVPVAAAAPMAMAANNQRFSFVNNSATPQALKRFEIEQAGARFRVLDSDGSVYPGRTLSNGTFHVAGMNKTLRQPVVFTGQVFRASLSATNNLQQQSQAQGQITTTANSAALAQNQNQTQRYFNNAANNSVYSNLSNNSDELRVQGQALIGNNQYKVDAQSAPGQ
jgi:hypothetical protein